MLEIVIGPVLFAVGLLVVFAAINGLPSRDGRPSAPRQRPRSRLDKGDTLVVEILSEMLNLREEMATLKSQVASRPARVHKQAREVA